ncbi:hypothetical protein [Streptomyces sp. NPDC060184]|uniref:hypothetical protein n=1 Tax=Streptomyces sp. NPDC060184 TaxID=3347064 RepID=UPI00365FC725
MSEGIFINHQRAQVSALTMETQQRLIKDAVGELQQNLNKVIGFWEGPDQEFYYGTVVPTWQRQIELLDQQLGTLVQILQENSQTYARTAARAASNFENIR